MTLARPVQVATRAVGALLVVIGIAGFALVRSSAAQSGTYTVVAEASSGTVRLEFPDAGLVVGSEVLNAAPTRATAQLDSLGTSFGFAAAGYPGDIVSTLPSTVVGVASGFQGARELVPLLPPIPPYPLAARSDAANPEVVTESGAFTVRATTGDDASHAEAVLGVDEEGNAGGQARSFAATILDPATETPRGEAMSELTGLRIANLVEVSQRSVGNITASGGRPSMSTASFFGVSLLGSGLQAGFGRDGLVAAGNSLADRTAVESVATGLAVAGIGLEYLPETRSEDGSSVTSAGMRITYTFTAPDEAAFLNQFGLPFNANVGRIVASVTLGQVAFSARSGTLPVPAFGGGSVSPPAMPGGGTPSGLPSGTGATGGGVLATPGASGAGAATPASAPVGVAAAPQATSAVEPPGMSSSSFYLVMVGAGVAAIGASRLFGQLAVRQRLS